MFYENLSTAQHTMLPGGAKKVNFLEISNFATLSRIELPSSFQLYNPVGDLIGCQVLARLLCNWGDLGAKF